MDDPALYAALIDALDRLDVPVRFEPLPEAASLAGGLCVLKGQRLVIVSSEASLPDRIEVLAAALRELDTETLWLAPAVRARIARSR